MFGKAFFLCSRPISLAGLLTLFLLLQSQGLRAGTDIPAGAAAQQPAAPVQPAAATPGRNSMEVRYQVGRLLRDAREQRNRGDKQAALAGTLEAATVLRQAGFAEDQVKVLRDMTLDTDPDFVRAGARSMAEYYYRYYLNTKPRDAQWLLDALGWVHYAPGNEDLLKRFTARAPDKAHENIDERGRQRGEELRADDQLYQVGELIRTSQLEAFQQRLAQWPYDINRLHTVEGTALLHMAVWHKKPEFVKWLVEVRKADVNVVDRENDTPLDYAQYQGAADLVAYLRIKGGVAHKQYQPQAPKKAVARAKGQPTLEELKKNNPAALVLPTNGKKTGPATAPAASQP